jgi:hypothetical protein
MQSHWMKCLGNQSDQHAYQQGLKWDKIVRVLKDGPKRDFSLEFLLRYSKCNITTKYTKV